MLLSHHQRIGTEALLEVLGPDTFEEVRKIDERVMDVSSEFTT